MGRRHRHAAGALIAALAAGVLIAPVATADDSTVVVTATVYPGGGPSFSRVATYGALSSCDSVQPESLDEYGFNGDNPVNVDPVAPPGGAWDLGVVLSCAMQLPNVQAVTVYNSGVPETGDGGLNAADLTSPSDFPNPSQQPAVVDGGSSVTYYRPWRGGSDDNARDTVQGQGLPLQLDVYTGPAITGLSINASQTTVAAGDSVNFTLNGGDSDQTATWDFGDGDPPGSGRSVSETFATAGTYDVGVTAIDQAAGSAGRASITITVTGAQTPPATTRQPGSGVTTTAASPAGPAQSTSGVTHGGQPPGRHPRGQRHAGSGGSTTPAPTSTTSAASSTTPAASTTTGTARPPAAQRRTPAAARAPGRAAAPASAPAPHPAGGTHRRAHPSPLRSKPVATSPGRPIAGQLISDVVPIAAARSPLTVAAAAAAGTAPPVRAGGGSSPLAAAAGGLAIVLLLGLGAGRELRGRRIGPRRPPPAAPPA